MNILGFVGEETVGRWTASQLTVPVTGWDIVCLSCTQASFLRSGFSVSNEAEILKSQILLKSGS